jgi:hypothetical protein
MTREELKALGLSDEQIEKIVDDYGKNYVSKSQFNQKNEEAKHLKGEADTFKKEIEELKKTNKDNADLAAQIEKMKEDAKTREQTYKANTKKMQIDSLVDLELIKNKAKNPKAVKALLVDLDKAEIVDGSIKGLDEQFKKLKETDAYMFETEDDSSGSKGFKAGQGDSNKKSITHEDFTKMSYAQRLELHNSNKELYDSLNKGE